MIQIKTAAPKASFRRRLGIARCVALTAALVFGAVEAQAQSGDGRGMSRGDYQGHRGGRGGGIGAGVAGALIGLGVGIIAESARARASRADTAVDDEERPTRRRPPKRRVVVEDNGPDRDDEPRARPKRPVSEPKPKVARTTPAKPGRPAKVERVRLDPKPPKGGRPPVAAPAPAVPPPAAVLAADRSIVPDEVLCEIRAGTPDTEIAAIGRRQRLVRMSIERFDLTGATIVRYRIRDRRPVGKAVEDLQGEPAVAAAQPNGIFELSEEAASKLAPTQYAVAMMRLGEAHAAATGAGVKIAVIDSAVDPDHPALKGAVAGRFDPVGGEATPHVHGTAVAGLAAGRGDLMSPAPRAEIFAVRAFAPEHRAKSGAQGTTIHILRGLDWAAGQSVKVVNMSFAGPRDAKISEFIAAAAARGVIHVAAAGNAGPSSPPLYPAADPNVIAVTAVDADDGVLKVANRGPHLSIAAPGVDVLVATPGGGFGYLSGTSMASAEISGLVALLVEAKPGLAAWQARAALTNSARDLGAPGPDPDFGAGAADARAALDALDAPSTPEIATATPKGPHAAPVSASAADVAQRP